MTRPGKARIVSGGVCSQAAPHPVSPLPGSAGREPAAQRTVRCDPGHFLMSPGRNLHSTGASKGTLGPNILLSTCTGCPQSAGPQPVAVGPWLPGVCGHTALQALWAEPCSQAP